MWDNGPWKGSLDVRQGFLDRTRVSTYETKVPGWLAQPSNANGRQDI